MTVGVSSSKQLRSKSPAWVAEGRRPGRRTVGGGQGVEALLRGCVALVEQRGEPLAQGGLVADEDPVRRTRGRGPGQLDPAPTERIGPGGVVEGVG